MLDVDALEPVAYLTHGLHVRDAGVVVFEGELAEIRDGGEKKFGVGRLKMLNESIKHGNTVRSEEVIRQKHVDMGTGDDGRIQQRLMDVAMHCLDRKDLVRSLGDGDSVNRWPIYSKNWSL